MQQMPTIEKNQEFELAYRYVTETNMPVFLTGKAGTGKTTFLKYLKENCGKNMVVAAPTGVAAINAGGVTLHSLFTLPLVPYVPASKGWGNNQGVHDKNSLLATLRYRKDKIKLLCNLDLLVIDEVSMVRADVFDMVDTILRHVRRQFHKPFGGVQLLLIGDLFQLPPVAKDDELRLLQQYYATPFFFSAMVMQECAPKYVELNTIYRQKESKFIELLNQVRHGNATEEVLQQLNARFVTKIPNDDYITLTSHNAQADQINLKCLGELPGRVKGFKAEVSGDFPEHIFPGEAVINLKVGARVMFTKNHSGGKYYNGKIVEVISIDEEDGACLVKDFTNGEEISVTPVEWNNTKYKTNDADHTVVEDVVGTFKQLPLRLAWAITIHKSQGLTFDYVAIDAARAFAGGQLYVALSRCTQLNGIALLSKVPASAMLTNSAVINYTNDAENNLQASIDQDTQKYLLEVTSDLYNHDSALYELRQLDRLCSEHRAEISHASSTWLRESLTYTEQKLQQVGARFVQEIFAMQGDTQKLFERCTKANGYFTTHVQYLMQSIANYEWAIDSKTTSSAILDLLTSIYDALNQKYYVYSSLPATFNASTIHELQRNTPQAKVDLKVYAMRSAGTRIPEGVRYPELFVELQLLRNQICDEQRKDIFMVANNKTLTDMCNFLPLDRDGLLHISGFGKTKVAMYGSEFLEVLQRYARNKGLSTKIESHEKFKSAVKKASTDKQKEAAQEKTRATGMTPTVQATWDLFEIGFDIERIAKEREFSPSTILSHLSACISLGKVTASKIIGDVVYAECIQAIHGIKEDRTLNAIRSALDNKYDFGVVRVALAQWEYDEHR
jgi:PIF1-like helicase/Helix-turn-helix domain/HRDC domain/UvrD-like helicase C-terminal domain